MLINLYIYIIITIVEINIDVCIAKKYDKKY